MYCHQRIHARPIPSPLPKLAAPTDVWARVVPLRAVTGFDPEMPD